MTFTKEMVDKYAEDLLIGLTEEENKMVLDEFEIIDKNINIINDIENLENVEPMTHCLEDLVVDFRSDVVEESSNIDDILKNCDSHINDEVKVPRVVE